MTVTGLWCNVTSRDIIVNGSSVRFFYLLYQQGYYTRTYGRFYLELVQYVILFGSESQVVTPSTMQALGSLHNWLAQWISGWMPWCRNVRWQYSLIVEALSDAGIYLIGGYISQRHIIAAQYITTRPIFDLVVTEERQTIFLDTIILREQQWMWFINEGRGACNSQVEQE